MQPMLPAAPSDPSAVTERAAPRPAWALLVSLCAALALAACGEPDRKTSQVAAKVNGADVSVHQVNGTLTRAALQGPQAASHALERVIDEELLVQKALAMKLDREPGTLQAMEAARRQVLAQAWLERVNAGAPGPEDIRRFYQSHPELFAQRRVYSLEELVVTAPAETVQALAAAAPKLRSLADAGAWLQARNVRYAPASSTRASEQIPLERLRRVAQMKQHDIAVFATPDGAAVTRVAQSRAAPLGEREAAPLIEAFLRNRARSMAWSAEIKRLRSVAAIDYYADFGGPRRLAPAQPEVSHGDAAHAASNHAGTMERGLSGLR